MSADAVSPTSTPAQPELYVPMQDVFDGGLNSPAGTEHIAPAATVEQAAAAAAATLRPVSATLHQPDQSDRLAAVFATTATLALASVWLFAWLS